MAETTVIRTLEEFDGLKDEWSSLLEKSNCEVVFLQWEWIRCWIDSYLSGDDLFCVMVKDEDRLIGLAPFWISTRSHGGIISLRTLSFLGSTDLCPDHIDILTEPSKAGEVATAIGESLFGELRGEWDLLEYHQVPSDSSLMSYLWDLAELSDQCLRQEISEYSTSPYVVLPKDPDELLQVLRPNRRKRIANTEKRLSEEGELKLVFCEKKDEIAKQINDLIKLHTDRWEKAGEGGSFSSKRIKEFHHAVAQKLFLTNELFLCALYLDDEPIGALYGYRVGQTVDYYSIAVKRHPNSRVVIGDYLLFQCYKRAIELGCTEFDLLRGTEPYKYMWTSSHRRDLNLNFYNRTPRSLMHLSISSLKQCAKHWLKSTILRGSSQGGDRPSWLETRTYDCDY